MLQRSRSSYLEKRTLYSVQTNRPQVLQFTTPNLSFFAKDNFPDIALFSLGLIFGDFYQITTSARKLDRRGVESADGVLFLKKGA